ncbi:unnamed protein product [Sphagnum jensenii]|uniref:Uncharacterized protein n=1 Tax=Sphagnum jensenii TaxID=128206 RepID=A0ABP1B139_9BRYO
MKVAFHKDIMTTYVTIDGDIFEPRGLLTGGSRKGRGELLLRLHSLIETEANLAVHTRKLSEIESEIATLAPLQKKFTLLKSQLELKTYNLSLFEGQAERIVSLTSELQNENKELVKKDEEHQECLKTVEAFKKSLKDHGQGRENRLQALEKEIKSLKEHLTSVSEDFKEADEMTIGTLTTKLTSVYWIVVNCFIHLFCLIPPIELILPHISGDTSNM